MKTFLGMFSSSTTPGPGMFFYTQNMPVIINVNLYVSSGIVNGKDGKAIDLIIDYENTQLFKVPEITEIWGIDVWICMGPPTCVFIKVKNPCHTKFDGLDTGVFLLFPMSCIAEIKLERNVSLAQPFRGLGFKVSRSVRSRSHVVLLLLLRIISLKEKL